MKYVKYLKEAETGIEDPDDLQNFFGTINSATDSLDDIKRVATKFNRKQAALKLLKKLITGDLKELEKILKK